MEITNETARHGARQRIVVGVDGSSQSERALQWAAHLAACTGNEVDALIAWAPQVAWGLAWIPGGLNWNPAEDAAKLLDIAVERALRDPAAAAVRRRVVEGGAAKALIDAGREASMLVVGSRGHGGFAGMLLGSVSAACAEHAACPVLVVHGDTPPPA